MSLSIPHAVLIRAATRLAGDVANRIGQTIRFDDVLRGDDVSAPLNPLETQPPLEKPSAAGRQSAGLREELTAAVQTRLSDSGIKAGETLQLSVTNEGRLSVEGNHPRAGEIESLLNSDPELVETARQWSRTAGHAEISIDLTIPTERENMVWPGGYPNW